MISAGDFLESCVLLDLETDAGNTVFHIGAIYKNGIFERKGRFDLAEALQGLDEFCRDADYILGHNITGHDLMVLESLDPDLGLLKLPVVDTLYLSPLAFPENPYHRLVKDYKLVKSSLNDPVADARLAGKVFRDQWESLRKAHETNPEFVDFLTFCFENGELTKGRLNGGGIADVLIYIGGQGAENRSEAADIFKGLTKGQVCSNIPDEVLSEYMDDPFTCVCMAYVLAWLTVAGNNSVLPPWVRLRFPEITGFLSRLRDTPCLVPSCLWCTENHDPKTQLGRYFGFNDFRRLPDGRELQLDLVSKGMRNEPLLGILPTGGGKSICYQLPALSRYHRRGHLSIIISPLQALMKDQVDNLRERTGSNAIAAINGLLTPIERGAVLEQVRLGDIGLLYISPEQLRNHSVVNAIKHREIGCWIFDEAHCLSKWGHDFRPDYLYTARFIKEFAEKYKSDLPPVACYTATAKKDVIEDIIDHFKERLGFEMELFEGGVERENLSFEVQMVTKSEKYETIQALLTEYIGHPASGSAIVYCATQKNTEEMASAMKEMNWNAEAFHGGMTAPEKRDIQERFIGGEIPVIAATNAFGMGIDKEDVRLVIHADIPGSLENYLQEAGRAGRDQKEAHCVLLFDESDLETQHKLCSMSALQQRDIAQILRGLRNLNKTFKNDEDEIIVTAGELLRDDHVDTSFESGSSMADTKVKTAVSWLERAGFLERNENRTSVFQGEPRFNSMEEVAQKLDRLNLGRDRRNEWETILELLINGDPETGLRADDIAGALGKKGYTGTNYTTKEVMASMHEMTEAGLIKKGVLMTAYIRPKGKNNSRRVLQNSCELEKAMLETLIMEHPDGTLGEWIPLSIRMLNQRLVDQGHKNSNPELLQKLLSSLSQDGKGFAGKTASISLKHSHQDHYRVKLNRDWSSIKTIMERRHNIAYAILGALESRVPPSSNNNTGTRLVEFSSDDLSDALRRDISADVQEGKLLAAIDRGLLFLHEQKAIILQKGLSIFRQAMTIRVYPEKKSRRYTKGDFAPLEHHNRQRTFQVHVMNEFASKGAEKIKQALTLVACYFTMDQVGFIKRFFPGREEMLQRATSEKSYKRIVHSLNNPEQEAIVAGDVNANALILAGPGSGKTRTVVHRCAWLLRSQRIPAHSILILCFNHNAAVTLRKRLLELVGNDARGVAVLTYHALAMRLTGTSFARREYTADNDSRPDFDEIIRNATDLLKGETSISGLEPDEIRDRLLSGYQYILVDEYQDIDQDQYELVSALTGKTLIDPDRKLTILAVGDDDQSIYAFRNANVKFIRQFKADYNAKIHHLVENYRSSHHIIEASNSLIQNNRERMKTELPIRIDKKREKENPGGIWEEKDPVTKGRVQIIHTHNLYGQADAVAREIRRRKTISPDLDYSDIAIFARNGINHDELATMRSALESANIPVNRPVEKDSSFNLARLREFVTLVQWLKQREKNLIKASEIIDTWHSRQDISDNTQAHDSEVLNLLKLWQDETGDSLVATRYLTDFLYEAAMEQKKELRLGQGVYLSTAHSAKGLEFKHVFILDGAWRRATPEIMDEERRLYYVAMTRAEEMLTLIQRTDCENPHIPLISPNHTTTIFHDLPHNGKTMNSLNSPGPVQKYKITGMKDLFLDYPGRMIEGSNIHKRLARLQKGDKLIAKAENNTIGLYAENDTTCVARLSSNACSHWIHRLTSIVDITIIAIIVRYHQDVQPNFQNNIKCSRWEIPIVEICFFED